MSTDAKRLEEIKARADVKLTEEETVANLIKRLTHILQPGRESVFNTLPSDALKAFGASIEKYYETHASLKNYLSNLSELQKSLVLQKMINDTQSALWANRLGIGLPGSSLSAERKVSAAATAEIKAGEEVKEQSDITLANLNQLKHILEPGRESNFQFFNLENLQRFRLFLEKDYETNQSLKYYLSGLLDSQKENVLKFFPETAQKVIWRSRLGLPALLPVELKRTAENAQVQPEEGQQIVVDAQAVALARVAAERIKSEQEQLQLLQQQRLKKEQDEREQRRQRDLTAAAQRKAQEDAERSRHRGYTVAQVLAAAQRFR